MAYNRLNSPQHEGGYSPGLNPRYDNRSPSPGRPLQSYDLSDAPYQPQRPHLQMPTASSDRLAMQPTYSVENMLNSYGHNQGYENQHAHSPAPEHDTQHLHSPNRMSPGSGYPSQDYVVSPEGHHDAYYTQPYEPHSQGDYVLDSYPTPQEQYRLEPDNQPILHPAGPYGPGIGRQQQYEDEPPMREPAPNPAPVRRWKTVKEVQLFNGNLVLDCPVPPRLLEQIPHAQPPERDEFTHMRYSAATCDPANFFAERFTLRQKLFATPRKTELFIVVTMYNEDDFLFARTMIGIFKNIQHICSRTNSKTWGKDAWKKIVVCVVSDGRAKINERTKGVLAGLGVYQDGIAKQQVNGKDVTAHIYEYTTQVGLELKGSTVSLKPRTDTPVQMLFCLKEKNQKKINSHRWFFQAFGQVLNPNICVLLDAGTQPGKDSIYHLWKAFDREPMCGGACGEIKVMLNGGRNLYNPLIATQNFEYKMSNILDKPLESSFGFISVLPGAFSAYRYVALQNDKNGEGPLEKYFKGETMHGEVGAGVFTANMYLAEDRILCFELVSKRNCSWILQYVKSASGETDVPDGIAEFILQRRRWLNGSFFAAVYAIAHFYKIWRSDHSAIRKFMFFIEFTYQTINMLFAWLAIGNFFLVFRLLTTSLGSPDLLGKAGVGLGVAFEWLYLITLVFCFILALGNRPQGSPKIYYMMSIFWGVLMVYLTFAAVFLTVKSIQHQIADQDFTFKAVFHNLQFFSLIVSLLSTYVMWFVASLLFFDPWHMFTCLLQYIILTPTYINILNIYAFCNTHDITWGTKGDDVPVKLDSVKLKPGGKVDVQIPQDDGDLNAQYEKELSKFAQKAPKVKNSTTQGQAQEDYYKQFRSYVVVAWIACNFTLCAVVLSAAGLERIDVNDDSTQRTSIYLAVILWSVAGLSLFRFIGAMWFLVVRMFRGV